jgi:Relaxase/Mobilisation nuclease domain
LQDHAHRHVHVIVNLIDPDTGKAVSLSNDAHKLDRWADDYEVAQGVIRSPDRRAKFHALDNGLRPPKRPSQMSREEWEATRQLHSEQRQQRAVEIKATYAAKVAAIKGRPRFAREARTTEGEVLWKTNRADTKAIHDRYQPFIDASWKSRRKSQPHPFTVQALRDMWELHEWKKLGQRQWRQRRAFDARERSFLGVVHCAQHIRMMSSPDEWALGWRQRTGRGSVGSDYVSRKGSSAASLAVCDRKFESATPTSRTLFGGGNTDRIRSKAT